MQRQREVDGSGCRLGWTWRPGATHIVVDWKVVVDITGDSLSTDLGVGCVLVLHFHICSKQSLST